MSHISPSPIHQCPWSSQRPGSGSAPATWRWPPRWGRDTRPEQEPQERAPEIRALAGALIAGSVTGRVAVKMAPPRAPLAAASTPPCACMIRRAMVSPRLDSDTVCCRLRHAADTHSTLPGLGASSSPYGSTHGAGSCRSCPLNGILFGDEELPTTRGTSATHCSSVSSVVALGAPQAQGPSQAPHEAAPAESPPAWRVP